MQKFVKSVISAFGKKARQYRIDQAGNVAMMLGLSAIPMFLAAGSAIDFSRISNTKSNLVAALDSAALYAASLTGKTDAEMKTLARTYFDSNYTNTGDSTVMDFDLVNYADHVTVTGKANVKTWFMNVAGINNLDVPAKSEVMKSGSSIEVSLVLDNTNSMGTGTKMADLKAAAIDFVDTVVWAGNNPYYSKVAVIPYNNGVNVGAFADVARGVIGTGTSTSPGKTNFTFSNGSTNKTFAISTCASERTGAQAYTDASVVTSKVGMSYPAPGNPCISTQVLPLTNNKVDLKATINSMTAGSSTAGQVGIAWGWYAISPNFGLWSGSSVPASYTADHLHKIMILMTDAEYNSGYCKGVISGAPTVSGSGAAADHINCAATNGNSYTQSTSMCGAIKASGIEVYTIEFELDTTVPARVALMNSCATDAAHRITATNSSDLKKAFQKIAANLLELRLSQ